MHAAQPSKSGFSVTFTTPSEEKIVVRAMRSTDGDGLLKFFRRIPADDRQYLREDGTSPEVVQGWTKTLGDRRVLPLVALARDRIVGEATLHPDTLPAHRHTGHLRILIDPAYRNQGLGRFMMMKLVDIARDADSALETVVMEVVADAEQAAQHAASTLGFVEARDFTKYVHYYSGRPHDLIVMELHLRSAPAEEAEPAQSMF